MSSGRRDEVGGKFAVSYFARIYHEHIRGSRVLERSGKCATQTQDMPVGSLRTKCGVWAPAEHVSAWRNFSIQPNIPCDNRPVKIEFYQVCTSQALGIPCRARFQLIPLN